MLKLTSPVIHDTLLTAIGQPDPEVIDGLDLRAQATVKSLLGDKNDIWIGKPVVFDLLALAHAAQAELPIDLTTLASSHDFVLVQVACSFRPAPDCEFVQSTVRLHLENPQSPSEYSVAHDIFPRSVEIPVSYKREFSCTPTLKLSFIKIAQIEASAFVAKQSEEYIGYEPEITAFGVGESSPGWDFNKTKSRPIRGIKDLFVIAKKPKGAIVEARFEVNGWVQTNLGIGNIPLSTFILSGSNKPLAIERFRLI